MAEPIRESIQIDASEANAVLDALEKRAASIAQQIEGAVAQADVLSGTLVPTAQRTVALMRSKSSAQVRAAQSGHASVSRDPWGERVFSAGERTSIRDRGEGPAGWTLGKERARGASAREVVGMARRADIGARGLSAISKGGYLGGAGLIAASMGLIMPALAINIIENGANQAHATIMDNVARARSFARQPYQNTRNIDKALQDINDQASLAVGGFALNEASKFVGTVTEFINTKEIRDILYDRGIAGLLTLGAADSQAISSQQYAANAVLMQQELQKAYLDLQGKMTGTNDALEAYKAGYDRLDAERDAKREAAKVTNAARAAALAAQLTAAGRFESQATSEAQALERMKQLTEQQLDREHADGRERLNQQQLRQFGGRQR